MSNEVSDNIGKLIGNLDEKYLQPALLDACSMLQSEAVNRAPVDTGNLHRSIEIQVEGTEGVVYTNAEYAVYQEVGTGVYSTKGNGRKDSWVYKGSHGFRRTSGNKPQPFMQPALDACQQKIIDVFQNLI